MYDYNFAHLDRLARLTALQRQTCYFSEKQGEDVHPPCMPLVTADLFSRSSISI